MNRNQYKKIFMYIIFAALVVSVVTNFRLISKIDQLENQVNNLSSNQRHLLNSVNSQTNRIQHILTDIQEQQSWLGPIRMDIQTEQLEKGQTEATFEWQVRELHRGSEVFFHYVVGDSENYKAIQAKEIEQGLYRAKIPVKVALKPQWDIGIISTGENTQQEMSKKEMEKRMEENSLKYYVSVSSKNGTKSGEIHTEHLGQMETGYYGILQTDVNIDNDMVNIMLTNHNVSGNSIVVEKAYLLRYKDDTLLGEEMFNYNKENTPTDNRVRFFHIEQVEKYENMRLVIKVVYSNGKTFKKKIYSS